MKKLERRKVITLVVIFTLVIGFAIGFSAFSTQLLIKSRVRVEPDLNLKVIFNANPRTNEGKDNSVSPKTTGYAEADVANIDNSIVPTIDGISATFAAPGDTVTYDFYVLNEGQLDAYLTNVNYQNVENKSTYKVCTADSRTDQSSVDSACSSIKVTVTIGEKVINNTASVSSHILKANSYESVSLKIEYVSGGAEADGPFTVDFGDISLLYNQLDSSSTPEGSTGCRVTKGSGTNNWNEITCGSEKFWVIDSDSSTVTMIAQKNLNLSGTPKQSDSYQTFHFTNYTVNEDSYSCEYYENYSNNCYDINFTGSNLYPYLASYESYLKNSLNISSAKVSLLTYKQLINAGGCTNEGSSSDSYSDIVCYLHLYLKDTFWLGTVYGENYGSVFRYNSEGALHKGTNDYNLAGIRPVVTMKKLS